MKKIFAYISIHLIPFVLMVAVNEWYRGARKEKSFTKYPGVMNSGQRMRDRCSWACHEATAYCKKNHVKSVKSNFEFTDSLYFGLIGGLRMTGVYQAANVFFLVLAVPLLIWFFLYKSLDYQYRIQSRNRN